MVIKFSSVSSMEIVIVLMQQYEHEIVKRLVFIKKTRTERGIKGGEII